MARLYANEIFPMPVAEELRRPPTLEVSTAPHAYFSQTREFERAIDPAAATPAWRPHIPVRVIVKRNEDERFGHLAHPQRREMMEISGAVNQKPGKFAADLSIETLNYAGRCGETERWSQIPGIERR